MQIINKLNTDNIKFKNVVFNKNKRLHSGIIYTDPDEKIKYETPNMYFKTPVLITPFGISAYQHEGNEKAKKNYTLSLSAQAISDNDVKSVEHFFNQLIKLDHKMVDFGINNSEEIFGKKYTEKQKQVVEVLYCNNVKISDAGYPPRISPKFKELWEKKNKDDKKQSPTGRPNVNVYTISEENKDEYVEIQIRTFEDLVEAVPAGSYVQAILKPNIWFIGRNKFGISLSVYQLLIVQKKNNKPMGFGAKVKNKSNSTEINNDSDEEDEQDEEEYDEEEE